MVASLSSWKRTMKQTKYYRIDNNFDLVEVSKEDEIFKAYENSENLWLLKLEILPIDINIAPLKRLPDYYARQKLLLLQSWEEDRKRIQLIIDKAKEDKRTRQPILLRVYSARDWPFAEHDKKNDPRNRIDISKGIHHKWKRGKRPPPPNQTMV
jgi:hypothetical protein